MLNQYDCPHFSLVLLKITVRYLSVRRFRYLKVVLLKCEDYCEIPEYGYLGI